MSKTGVMVQKGKEMREDKGVAPTQEVMVGETFSKLNKEGKEMGKDEELAPIQEAVKNLDVTAFLAEASKMNKKPIKLPEELQAFLKYGMQLLITNPTLQNVNFLLGKLSELGDNESEEGNLTASLLVASIFGAAERLHDEGFIVPTPDPEQINGFIRERSDLLNQLADEGLSSEALKSKSNQELKLMLAQKNLNS